MQLILEAGIFGILIVVTFAAGSVVVVRSHDALRAAQTFALTVVLLGIAGAGLGQRLVDKAVDRVTDPAEKVALLSVGTREASAGHLLGGACGILLLGLGGAIHLARRRED